MDSNNTPANAFPPLPASLRTEEFMSRELGIADAKISSAHRQISDVHAEVGSVGNLYLHETWERLAEERPDLAERLDLAESAAKKALNQTRERIGQIKQETDAVTLTVTGVDRSNAMDALPLVTAELNSMSPTQMRDALRVALVNEDRPSLYLYSILMPKRIDEIKERSKGEDGQMPPSSERDALMTISGLLVQARKHFRSQAMAPLSDRAKNIARQQDKLEHLAGLRKFVLAPKIWEDPHRRSVSWIEGDSREDPQHGKSASALIRQPESR